MKTAAVISEFNPFHAGHALLLRKIRLSEGEDTAILCIMSGNYTQRGEAAVICKQSRAAAAIEGGADLVLEVPTVWACASAEAFARGAVAILQAVGAQALSFGSESGDAAALARAAQALDSADYRLALRGYLDRGLPFARCRHLAAQTLLGEAGAACLARANDNLGVEYLRAARHLEDWRDMPRCRDCVSLNACWGCCPKEAGGDLESGCAVNYAVGLVPLNLMFHMMHKNVIGMDIRPEADA